MKRRDFLTSIIAAGVASAFLPSAVTYGRRWAKLRAPLVGSAGFCGIVTFNPFTEYEIEFVGSHISGFQLGGIIEVGTTKAIISELEMASGRTSVKARAWHSLDLSHLKSGNPSIAGLEPAIIRTTTVWDSYEFRPS